MGPYCYHCEAETCEGKTAECGGRSDGRGTLDAITEAAAAPQLERRERRPLNFNRPAIFPTL